MFWTLNLLYYCTVLAIELGITLICYYSNCVFTEQQTKHAPSKKKLDPLAITPKLNAAILDVL